MKKLKEIDQTMENNQGSSEIVFRPLKRKDYGTVSKIICQTWRFDQASSPKIAALAADMYLHMSLGEQNFTRVAEKNGNIIGVIIGKVEKRSAYKLLHNLALRWIVWKFMMSKEGRRIWELFNSFFAINKRLLMESGRTYDGELVLFIVTEKEKRKGVGKALLTQFLEHMRQFHATNFYLFTDSYCDYEFYDRNEFSRVGELATDLELHSGRKMSFFLYEGKI